jgi:hypothetical protein
MIAIKQGWLKEFWSVHLTVNTPTGEYEYKFDSRDMNSSINEARRHHPNLTSLVVALVPVVRSNS